MLPSDPAPVVAKDEEWWTPPANTKRQAVEVLAYGFEGIDERDLGAMFTENLEPIVGAPHFFEEGTPKHTRRNEVDLHWLRSWDKRSIDTGATFLFIGLGVDHTSAHDSVVFHSREVREVISVNENARMRQPPPKAVFYLAEVHSGTCVDYMFDGDYSETGAKLSLLFQNGSASAKHVQAHGRYEIRLRALGLRDFTGEGALAMTLDEIKRAFRADPATIELVFRAIPGRAFRSKEVPAPVPLVDEPAYQLDDGATSSTRVDPGRYRFVGTSSPNGLGVEWLGCSNCVECDQLPRSGAEYLRFSFTCLVKQKAELQISNPSTFNLGPRETMSLYLARLP